MVLILLLGSVTLLGFPGAARRLGRRLDPAEWARLCLFALVGGAVAAEAAFLLIAAPTALRAAGVTGLAAACERMVRPLTPGGPAIGWAATVAALAVPVMAGIGVLRARRTQHRCRVEPWIGQHEPGDGHDLVVLPTPVPLAHAVDGPHPQIVVSEGLVDVLSPAAFEAVLRHEAVHLTCGHQRYLLFASALDQALFLVPFARRSTKALRAALERWADEWAADAGSGSRAAVRVALMEVTRVQIEPPVAAFSAAETLIERLDALGTEPPRPSILSRAALYVPCLAAGTAVVLALGFWAGQARTVLAMAARCPV